MGKLLTSYKRYRFQPEIIKYAVWIYYRFNLSHRDIEDLLAQRGIVISYESIRLWCNKFGPKYARRLMGNHGGFGDTFYIDEVCISIRGVQYFLWRAVDQDGEIVDVFLQRRRDGKMSKKFFKRLFKTHRQEPSNIVTDKLKSYGVAHRELIPDKVQETKRYSNNRAELPHQPTRVREHGMRRLKTIQQTPRFVNVHAAVHNLFNLGRHLVSAKNYRFFWSRAFSTWNCAAA